MFEQGAGETEANEHLLSLVDDDAGAVREWEFMCECGDEACHESVFRTVAAFVALRDAGEAVVADGHQLSRAQTEHQMKRAQKNLGLT